MSSIRSISRALQQVLTDGAERAARDSGCIQRRRKFSGASLVQTLVLGWLQQPDASLTMLAGTARDLGVDLSPQALDRRFTRPLATCLEQTLAHILTTVIQARPVPVPLLKRFPGGVYLLDSTTVSLPAALAADWQGCGGHAGQGEAAVKLQVQLDLLTGRLEGPLLQDGRAADGSTPLQHRPLPAGSLRVADLGYFNLERLAALDRQQSFWITRLKANTTLRHPCGAPLNLVDWLTAHALAEVAVVDVPLLLGSRQQLPVRLLAERVPATVAAERRTRLQQEAQRKQQPASPHRLALADWTILVTNVPAEQLTPAEAHHLYRARWQIEQLFHLWKTHGQLAVWRSQQPLRILCEVYAKLIGLVLQHWLIVTGCWHDPARSMVKAAQVVRAQASHLVLALHRLTWLDAILRRLSAHMERRCRLSTRKTHPGTYQCLLNPTLSA